MISWRFIAVASVGVAAAGILGAAIHRADTPLRADGVLDELGLLLRLGAQVAAAVVIARQSGARWHARTFANMALVGLGATLLTLGLRAAMTGAWRPIEWWWWFGIGILVPLLSGVAGLITARMFGGLPRQPRIVRPAPTPRL